VVLQFWATNVSEWVLNGTSARERPFSAIQRLEIELNVKDSYRENKRMWLNQGYLPTTEYK